MKRVFKYGTGFEIPEGAVYLNTQVETVTTYDYHAIGDGLAYKTVRNELVWHYFLVEVSETVA